MHSRCHTAADSPAEDADESAAMLDVRLERGYLRYRGCVVLSAGAAIAIDGPFDGGLEPTSVCFAPVARAFACSCATRAASANCSLYSKKKPNSLPSWPVSPV